MGLLEILKGNMVYLDTAPIIYYIEDVSPYADLLDPVFQQIKSGAMQAWTSTLTLAETLVVPYRKKDLVLIEKFETLLTQSSDLTTLPLTLDIARETAKIRSAFSSIKTPDAVQLATACVNGIDYFLTNDKNLKAFSPLQVVVLDDFI